MFAFILLLLAVLLLIYIIPLRILVLHPFKTVRYFVQDTYHYFRCKKWRNMKYGQLLCYFADFGRGKTLSMAHFAVLLFQKYNNKKVWCPERKKWVTQKVHILSNFTLKTIPYEPLTSLSQFVNCAYKNKRIDNENDTLTVVLCMIDEASAQLNSRSFKTNIDADFLNTLITTRHYRMSLYYSSQAFSLVDALLRTVTQKAVMCDKLWRVVTLRYFDAHEIEYASNPMLVKPLRKTGFFVSDKDYNAYDTHATVDKLKKAVDKKDMMSAEEIMTMRGMINPNNDTISTPSKRFFRLSKKKNK